MRLRVLYIVILLGFAFVLTWLVLSPTHPPHLDDVDDLASMLKSCPGVADISANTVPSPKGRVIHFIRYGFVSREKVPEIEEYDEYVDILEYTHLSQSKSLNYLVDQYGLDAVWVEWLTKENIEVIYDLVKLARSGPTTREQRIELGPVGNLIADYVDIKAQPLDDEYEILNLKLDPKLRDAGIVDRITKSGRMTVVIHLGPSDEISKLFNDKGWSYFQVEPRNNLGED